MKNYLKEKKLEFCFNFEYDYVFKYSDQLWLPSLTDQWKGYKTKQRLQAGAMKTLNNFQNICKNKS